MSNNLCTEIKNDPLLPTFKDLSRRSLKNQRIFLSRVKVDHILNFVFFLETKLQVT